MKYSIILVPLIASFVSGGSIPDNIPEWIEEFFYLDYSARPGGDGTYENPWKDVADIPPEYYSTTWPRHGWDYPRSAILFKRGVAMWGDNPRATHLRFAADSVYVGSYGAGAKALLVFNSNSRGLWLNGTEITISHVHIHNQDTVTFSEVLSVGGPIGSDREGMVLVDSVEISRGYRGLVIGNVKKADIRNTLIHTVNHDAVFITGSDSICFLNFHSYGHNRDWMWDRSGRVSGGDIIQAEGVAGNRIGYLEVDSSYLDFSMFGGKYAIIANQVDRTIVKNSVLVGHPDAHAGIRAANYLSENNQIYGFTHALWTLGGESVVRNTILAGYGKGFTFEGKTLDTPYLRGNFQNFYNNVVMYTENVFEYPARNINSRNNIYYDVGQVFNTGIRYYHGSRDLHWNSDGNQNSFDGYDEIIADPLFIDPQITRVHHVEVAGVGDGAWSWYEITRFPDLRVRRGSPAIGSADERVWDTEASFLYGGNATNDWGGSDAGDPVYMRPFTECNNCNFDLNGALRPQGEGYDIGAHEFSPADVHVKGRDMPYSRGNAGNVRHQSLLPVLSSGRRITPGSHPHEGHSASRTLVYSINGRRVRSSGGGKGFARKPDRKLSSGFYILEVFDGK